MAHFLLVGVFVCVALGVSLMCRGTKAFASASHGFGAVVPKLVSMLSRVGNHVHLAQMNVVGLLSCAQELCTLFAAHSLALSLSGACLLTLVLVVLAMLLGAIVAWSAIGMLVGAFVAISALAGWSSAQAKKRTLEIAQQVPDVYRSLSVALSSGYTLAQSIAYVASSGTGRLQREFSRASLMISCGISAVDALQELPERVEAPGIDLMISALGISARTGAPLQDLFVRSASLVERRFELERELTTKTAQVRLSARLVMLLPAGMVGLLILLSPDYRDGITTSVGMGCIAGAVILDALALFIIKRLMRGVI